MLLCRVAPELPPALARFSEATRAWFASAFHDPTAAQAGAWAAIASGRQDMDGVKRLASTRTW